MSIFDDDEIIKDSIEFFNELPNEEKVRIVSNLHPESTTLQKYGDKLFVLLSKIQKNLVKFDEIKIGNKLVSLGLEETYSRLIVSNMKKDAPTLSYQLSQINKIEDKHFIENFEKIVNAVWVDNENEHEIIEKYNITNDQYSSIIGVVSNLTNSVLRGEMTEKQIMIDSTNNGLSQEKAEILLKSIRSHKEIWHPTLMFRNTQDVFFNIDDLIKQNRQILNGMKEILKILNALGLKERRRLR